MERKNFLKTCGFACLGGTVMSALLESCKGSKNIEGEIYQSDLVMQTSSFQKGRNDYRKYIIVQNDTLKYPICVYRFSATEYTALLMRCTHQGTELQVFGARLQCPAHGSEFNNKGAVMNGPADTNLRTFPVTVLNDQLYISLK